MGKYGNIDAGLPDTFLLEKEAVLKAVKDGTISEQDGRLQVLKIQREANLWIVMTNGGYQIGTRRKKRALKKAWLAQQYLEQMKAMLAEAEKAPEGLVMEDPETPQAPVTPIIPIDTPSRGPVKPVDPAKEDDEETSELMQHLQPILDEAIGHE